MSVVDIMASTILASFDNSILEAVAQELIGVWIANPPGTNLQAIAQPINRFSAPAARSRIVWKSSEFDWQDHPLIKMGGRSICFHFRSPIQNWP